MAEWWCDIVASDDASTARMQEAVIIGRLSAVVDGVLERARVELTSAPWAVKARAGEVGDAFPVKEGSLHDPP